MKTIAELYKEVAADEKLQKEFMDTVSKNGKEAVMSFAKEHGCGATEEEIESYFKEKTAPSDSELSDAELDAVAGGKAPADPGAIGLSIFTLGIGCAIHSIRYAISGDCGESFK